ncbi:MAG: hypothetical protein SPI77_01040 [Corynebacterium sp.]|nr:hypothetical protein [Corynebacterium sp.]
MAARGLDNVAIPVSLKAYGDGPLQLSTDKSAVLFPLLEAHSAGDLEMTDPDRLRSILDDPIFETLAELNILPLIYRKAHKQCAIVRFDRLALIERTARIAKERAGVHGRKHDVWKFFDGDNEYICEVRYGGKDANALQRGLWTHTRQVKKYFTSLTGG